LVCQPQLRWIGLGCRQTCGQREINIDLAQTARL
jgi:hypothetical protein